LSTPAIFSGELPQAQFPVLAKRQLKSEIIAWEKRKKCPNGLEFLGNSNLYHISAGAIAQTHI